MFFFFHLKRDTDILISSSNDFPAVLSYMNNSLKGLVYFHLDALQSHAPEFNAKASKLIVDGTNFRQQEKKKKKYQAEINSWSK